MPINELEELKAHVLSQALSHGVASTLFVQELMARYPTCVRSTIEAKEVFNYTLFSAVRTDDTMGYLPSGNNYVARIRSRLQREVGQLRFGKAPLDKAPLIVKVLSAGGGTVASKAFVFYKAHPNGDVTLMLAGPGVAVSLPSSTNSPPHPKAQVDSGSSSLWSRKLTTWRMSTQHLTTWVSSILGGMRDGNGTSVASAEGEETCDPQPSPIASSAPCTANMLDAAAMLTPLRDPQPSPIAPSVPRTANMLDAAAMLTPLRDPQPRPIAPSASGTANMLDAADILTPLRDSLVNADHRRAIGEQIKMVGHTDSTTSSQVMSQVVRVDFNPFASPGTPLYAAFMAERAAHPSLSLQLAYHGTGAANIDDICWRGLDPSLRGRAHGQALGPGEYFGDVATAASYAYACRSMRRATHWGKRPFSQSPLTHDGEAASTGAIKILAFAILTEGGRGRGEAVHVISQACRQLPLAVVTSFLCTSEEAEFKTAEQEAEVAQAKAADADRIASAAEDGVKVVDQVRSLLIKGDVGEASAIYYRAINSNWASAPPAWAKALREALVEYLAPHVSPQLPRATLDDLFPWALPESLFTHGSMCVNLRSIRFGRFERLQQSAVELRANAQQLHAEAASATRKASELRATAMVAPPSTTDHRSLLASLAQPPAAAAAAAAVAPPATALHIGTVASAEATRRLMREYKKCMKQGGCREDPSPTSVFLPNEADLYTWRVELGFGSDTVLGRELRQFATRRKGRQGAEGAGSVQLELRFSGDFPSQPPFVRVVSPRFAFHTGHVTVGGSLCMAELTQSFWSSATSIETLLLLVRTALVEGGGTIDLRMGHVPYTLKEAREAYVRVAQKHGWTPV